MRHRTLAPTYLAALRQGQLAMWQVMLLLAQAKRELDLAMLLATFPLGRLGLAMLPVAMLV